MSEGKTSIITKSPILINQFEIMREVIERCCGWLLTCGMGYGTLNTDNNATLYETSKDKGSIASLKLEDNLRNWTTSGVDL